MGALAAHFDNATLLNPTDTSGALCTCAFGHTPQFPASTRLKLSVSPGERLERVSIVYRLQILPVFIRFKDMDQIVFPADAIDEAKAAKRVEDRLTVRGRPKRFSRTFGDVAVAVCVEFDRRGTAGGGNCHGRVSVTAVVVASVIPVSLTPSMQLVFGPGRPPSNNGHAPCGEGYLVNYGAPVAGAGQTSPGRTSAA